MDRGRCFLTCVCNKCRFCEARKTRDELSHTVFLMLQECNKFREHQAREVLIDLLEKQLSRRERLTKELERCVDEADQLLLRR
jgi:MED7 protein